MTSLRISLQNGVVWNWRGIGLQRGVQIVITDKLQTIPEGNRDSHTEGEKKKKQQMGKAKKYWLLKTEPGEWSWEDQEANGGVSNWDGVKNKQAQKNMKSMELGDLCFFYHSGTKARRVVGVVSVVRQWYEDDSDAGGAVDVKKVGEMRRPVDLAEMKRELKGAEFALFRQPRLSVVPVDENVWVRVCEMGGGFDGDDGGDG